MHPPIRPTDEEITAAIRDMLNRDITLLERLLVDNPSPRNAQRCQDNLTYLKGILQRDDFLQFCCDKILQAPPGSYWAITPIKMHDNGAGLAPDAWLLEDIERIDKEL